MNDENKRKLDDKLKDARINNSSERKIIEDKVEWLLKQNEDVIDTIDVRLLTPYYNELFEIFDVISMITVYPKIQEKIVKLNPSQYKLFLTIVKYMDKAKIDWINLTEEYLDSVTSGKYEDLFRDHQMQKKINELYNKKTEDLESKDINNIEYAIKQFTNMNMFGIKSYSDFKSINMNKKYNDLLIGNIKDEYMSKLTKADKLRNVILLKKFGYDLNVAQIFMKRYLDDYDEIVKIIDSEDDQEILRYLKEKKHVKDPEELNLEVERIKKENQLVKEHLKFLKQLSETHDLEELKQYNAQIKDVRLANDSYRIDSVIRKFFCRQKNKELYQLNPKDKVRMDNIDVYMVQDDFKMELNSLNSYSKALEWDVKKIQNHAICTTQSANNNMNHAPIYGACLGFNDLYEQSLYASAPWDLGSNDFANNMNISKANIEGSNELGKADIKFYTPNSQTNMTRRRNSEDIFERRELDPKKIDVENEVFKKQPAYVVYFSEESLNNFINNENGEILNSENLMRNLDFDKFNDLEYRRQLVEQYAQNDPLWNESKNEAIQRNKKIVVVDRTYYAIRERLKIDQIEKDVLDYDINMLNTSDEELNKFLNLTEKMIVESENNRAGLSIRDNPDDSFSGRLIHEELRERLFSQEIMQDRLRKIEDKISTLSPDKQKVCYKKLVQITKSEMAKYDHAYFSKDPGYNLEEYAKRYMQKSKNENLDISGILRDIDGNVGICGGHIICEAIADVKELDEYPSSMSEIHGQKHINNVILFSYLIAKGENKLDGKTIDLLVQAAKFHDVGRDGNWNGLGNGKRHDYDEIKHADPGALAAEFYLKKEKKDNGENKYSDEQIAMVQAAISYHEVREKNYNEFNEEVFSELCERYGISEQNRQNAKLMCIYLKDADAVDRTRFMQDYDEDKQTIPEHKRYMRRFWDDLNILYLRTDSSIALVDEARKIHKELLKRGCEHVFDEHGNVVNDAPETEIIDILKPYEDIMQNRVTKYKDPDNIQKIAEFLQNKKEESERNELDDLMNVCTRKNDKSLLAKLRGWGRKILEKLKIRKRENEFER